MARVYGIKKSLAEYGFDDKAVKAIIGNSNLVDVIGRMESALDPDTMHEILDRHACGGGKEFLDRMRKIGKELAGKALSEKIAHVNGISPASEKITLNADNTLTVKWSFDNNGKYKCVCGATIKTGVRVAELASAGSERVMPLAYCYCCAGSGRRHLELQLGVGLRTKEIISTPINSRGEKPCEFVLEIA